MGQTNVQIVTVNYPDLMDIHRWKLATRTNTEHSLNTNFQYMVGPDEIRDCVHNLTDRKLRVSERHDEYINIFIRKLNDFEQDTLERELRNEGYSVYPVTKQKHTRKLLVGD